MKQFFKDLSILYFIRYEKENVILPYLAIVKRMLDPIYQNAVKVDEIKIIKTDLNSKNSNALDRIRPFTKSSENEKMLSKLFNLFANKNIGPEINDVKENIMRQIKIINKELNPFIDKNIYKKNFPFTVDGPYVILTRANDSILLNRSDLHKMGESYIDNDSFASISLDFDKEKIQLKVQEHNLCVTLLNLIEKDNVTMEALSPLETHYPLVFESILPTDVKKLYNQMEKIAQDKIKYTEKIKGNYYND